MNTKPPTKAKLRTVRLYVHVVDDLFLPSLVVGSRRQRPAMHSRPPVLTLRQWALWWLVSGLEAGKDELFQEKPSPHMITLSVEKRMASTPWQRVEVHELPRRLLQSDRKNYDMNRETIIRHWLEARPEAALRIATHAVVPLLLDEEDGDWLGEADFPSGADYIDHIAAIMEAVGIYRHIDNLQKNGKAD